MGEAAAAVPELMAALDELLTGNPSNGGLPGLKASVENTAAEIYAKTADFGVALRYFRDGVAISARMQAEDPDNADAGLDIAQAYTALGRFLVKTRDPAGATELFRKALAFAEPQSARPRANEESLYTVAETYFGVGEAEEAMALANHPESRAEHLNQARVAYTRSLDLWSRVKEPQLLSPGGYTCAQPSIVKERLERVNQALESTD
jgi:tetratricopeptide (TPR) repeat protein